MQVRVRRVMVYFIPFFLATTANFLCDERFNAPLVLFR